MIPTTISTQRTIGLGFQGSTGSRLGSVFPAARSMTDGTQSTCATTKGSSFAHISRAQAWCLSHTQNPLPSGAPLRENWTFQLP